jgi:hypothetical protein
MAYQDHTIGSPEAPISPQFVDEKKRLYGHTVFPIEGEDAKLQRAHAWDQVRSNLFLNLKSRCGCQGVEFLRGDL